MSNANKIADAKAKLAAGRYDDNPARKAAVEANIERWEAEDGGVPPAEDLAPAEDAVRQNPPVPSHAAATLLQARGFTVEDMVSAGKATGDKITVDEVRVFLADQDG